MKAQGYDTFGSLLPGRNYSSGSYAHGFNGMRKDDEIHGATGTSYDFGDRLYDPRTGRWPKADVKAWKYPGYSPYHFGYCNPIITVDANGQENVVVIGNQSGATGGDPSSDFKNGKKADGYRYGENKRHFLEAGLNEAIRLKSQRTQNGEGTTMVVFKGTFTAKEMDHYRLRAEKAGILLLEVASATEITDYVNAERATDSFGDGIACGERKDDLITDFTYIGHGSPDKLWVGHESGESFIGPGAVKPEAFDRNANVILLGCGNGVEREDLQQMDIYKNRTAPTVFDDFQDNIVGAGGTVSGWTTTCIWGGGGIGTRAPFDKGYLFLEDRNGATQRQDVPPDKAFKSEPGAATR